MDKSTLSGYGWIIIVTLILAVMLALATPFGNYIGDGVVSVANSFVNSASGATDKDNIDQMKGEWENKLDYGILEDGVKLEGGRYYKDIKIAMADANNSTTENGVSGHKDAVAYVKIKDGISNVIFVKDIEITEALEITGNIIIHINGKTITMNTTGCFQASSGTLTIDGNIKNSTVTKTVDNPDAITYIVRSNGCEDLTISGGTYNCNILSAAKSVRILYSYDTINTNIKNVTLNVTGNPSESTMPFYLRTDNANVIGNKLNVDCTSNDSSKNLYGVYASRSDGAPINILFENNQFDITATSFNIATGASLGNNVTSIWKNNTIKMFGSDNGVHYALYAGGTNNKVHIEGIYADSDFNKDAPCNAYGIQTFGELTIDNSKEMETYVRAAVVAFNAGSPSKVVINGGTYESAYCVLHTYAGASGTFDVNGGTYRIVDFWHDISYEDTFGDVSAPHVVWISTGIPKATIKNATIEGVARNGVFLSGGNGQTVNIYNSTISAKNYDISLYTTGEIVNLYEGTILANNTISNPNGTVNDYR